ncbi:PREDICTED: flocculation protein FLO11-like [Rhagoletis zephyria]|uniref:flocculation protein FLO11-like n=1 Tax=Rhagoletis zephyria TaxID=28612 RepID=UPI0008114573|nr:PREDICTED: flocculation protein FLO11-like [Rhagoletis zephyria]
MLKLTVLLLCLAAGTSLAMSSNNLLRKTEINLLKLMMETRLHQRAHPERSLDCFDYYLQLFESISNEYKVSYAACLATAEEDRKIVDASTQPERESLEQSARSSCVALKDCSELSGSIDYFSCFAVSGKENTANMYDISANASEKLADVRESYRLIENSEHRCTNDSERAYVEQTYQANLDLQSCLRGETSVPTTTPKPSTTPDDPTTVASPGTTTEEPEATSPSEETTTEDPEITSPSEETTTEGPETTSPSEEPTTEDPETTTSSQDSTTEESDTTAATGETWTESNETTKDSDSSESSSSESNSSGSESSEAPENMMPEEDLRAIQIKRLAKIRAALSKY